MMRRGNARGQVLPGFTPGCGARRPPQKPPWSHPEATPKPTGSQAVATRKPPGSHPEATLRLPFGYPEATPRLPRGYPEATQRLPRGYPEATPDRMQNEECRMQNSRKRYIFTRSRGWMFASLSVTDSVPRTERECCATLHDFLSLDLEPIETAPSRFPSPPLRGRGCRKPERGQFRGAKRESLRGILSPRERAGVRGNEGIERSLPTQILPARFRPSPKS